MKAEEIYTIQQVKPGIAPACAGMDTAPANRNLRSLPNFNEASLLATQTQQ
ncbi:MAG: hypothetical protein Q8O64_19350 [Sideroxyarcus sp.]|nr:hypothetical protein [Sideroxyarcus sp.]